MYTDHVLQVVKMENKRSLGIQRKMYIFCVHSTDVIPFYNSPLFV